MNSYVFDSYIFYANKEALSSHVRKCADTCMHYIPILRLVNCGRRACGSAKPTIKKQATHNKRENHMRDLHGM